MKKRTLLLLLSLLPLSMTAQQKFLLRGQVVDAANDSPVSFATTALLRDSTAVAAVAADAQGRFELSAEAAGDYRLQITMVGYNPETQPVTLRTAATDAGTIRLRQGVDIDQVTVTIQKPLVTADAEKTTYSVEDDPQAASSTLEEILRKVPQLTIDAEGNVKLNGQSDFKVLVNGRSSAMFKNFKDVIRSMPASQIKKIEVITEPSMKYDAEGAGGIINIITARKEFDGYNGSLNYNTGLDTRQQYGGASLSVQKGKFAASVQAFFFQMNRRNRPYTSESRRENFASEQQRYHTSESTGYGKGHNEYVTLNLSYQPDTLNLVTLEGSLWTGAWKNSSDTRIRMSDAAETPTVAYDTHDYDNYPYTGFQVGANYERRFRKPEHTLTVSDMVEIDPDKGYNLVTYDGMLNYPSSQLYKRHTSRSFTNTFQLDYYNPLAEHHYVEAGSKYIYRINKGYQNEIPWIDPVGFDPTNMTKYDDLRQRQQIFSLYFGYGLKFSKVSARAGVRMERTWNHADADNSREGIYDYGNRLLNFIPYLSFTYKPRDGHNLSLSYTERLRRPSISMLSTYLDDSDPYNTSQGNPDLEASTTHTLSLKYNYFSPQMERHLHPVGPPVERRHFELDERRRSGRLAHDVQQQRARAHGQRTAFGQLLPLGEVLLRTERAGRLQPLPAAPRGDLHRGVHLRPEPQHEHRALESGHRFAGRRIQQRQRKLGPQVGRLLLLLCHPFAEVLRQEVADFGQLLQPLHQIPDVQLHGANPDLSLAEPQPQPFAPVIDRRLLALRKAERPGQENPQVDLQRRHDGRRQQAGRQTVDRRAARPEPANSGRHGAAPTEKERSVVIRRSSLFQVSDAQRLPTTAQSRSQNFCTVAISSRSSGECTPRSVGPNDTMSNSGYFSKNSPHSNPAWMARTLGFTAKSRS